MVKKKKHDELKSYGPMRFLDSGKEREVYND